MKDFLLALQYIMLNYICLAFCSEAPRFLQRPRSRNTTVGQTIRFLCEAVGNPSPQLNWLINGKPIKGNETF